VGVFNASKSWLKGFFTRHPEIGRRVTVAKEESRSHALNASTIREHLEQWERALKNWGVTIPQQVFNCDQTGVCKFGVYSISCPFSRLKLLIPQSYSTMPMTPHRGKGFLDVMEPYQHSLRTTRALQPT
jgi:hypothetical protein